jgi:dTDP-4-dehydrorhamnose 3,5-epimerase
MLVQETDISGLLIIKPSVFEDSRGYFMESYNSEVFKESTKLDLNFVQDNESKSNKGVLRGLHFQKPPYEQGKLVRVVKGSVLDVAVDIRTKSPTFGQYYSLVLSEENKTQFYVPPGFAHGFVVLEDNTIFSYKCTGFYNRESEVSIRWDDSDIKIDWGIKDPILSEKDKNSSVIWSNLNSPF